MRYGKKEIIFNRFLRFLRRLLSFQISNMISENAYYAFPGKNVGHWSIRNSRAILPFYEKFKSLYLGSRDHEWNKNNL